MPIDPYIKTNYLNPDNSIPDETFLVGDGIINPSEFRKTKPKILWILKESYGDEGDFLDLREYLSDPENFVAYSGEKPYPGQKTFIPIALVSWGIIKNKMDEIPDEKLSPDKDEDYEKLKIMNNIAYINCKKVKGTSDSSDLKWVEHYKKNKNLIIKQINEINPDIIICGGTYGTIYKDLGISDAEKEDSSVKINNKIIINAYHPSYISKNNPKNYYEYIFDEIKYYGL